MSRRPRFVGRITRRCASSLGVCALAVTLAVAAHAQSGTLSFGAGKAAFAPPLGFGTLSAEQLKQLLPTADARAEIVGDPKRGSTAAYAVIEIKLARAQMDAFRRYLTEKYTQKDPSLKWIVNRLETVGGRDGIRMEFSDDREMHHIQLWGHVDDEHAVMISYNTPLKELPTLEKALRASMASVRITP